MLDMKIFIRTLLTLSLAASVLAAPAGAAQFDLSASGKVVRLSGPVMAPDGRTVVVVVSRANYFENRFDSKLVAVEIASKALRVLTRGRRGVGSPRWSPDGTQLAFLAAADGRAQLFVLPLAGGEPRQVTKAPTGVQAYSWRPDGRAFAYTALDEEPKREGEERFNRSFEIGRNHFLQTETPRPAHLWVVPLDGGAARRITSGPWSLSYPPGAQPPPPSWSADGRSIVFERKSTAFSGDFDQSTVQIVDVATGELRALTSHTRYESSPTFSPDGSRIAYRYPRGGNSANNTEVLVAPVTGGQGRSVSAALDRSITGVEWMPDARALLLSANEGTTTGVWVQPLRQLDFKQLVVSSGVEIGRDGRLAFLASEPQRPAELYWRASLDAVPERLTDFNADIAALELGRTESLEWDGPDGFRMDAVLTYPPNAQPGRRYPLVVLIHGGPRGASKAAFSARSQLLAAQGWIVFDPNYRGSDALRDNGVPVQFIGYPLPGHSPADPVHQRDVDRRWIDWRHTHLAPSASRP